jgi:ABC-type antimicrobial peptide transport system permease subunit
MVLVGAAAGLGMGMASARFIGTLFFEVKATDLAMLTVPGAVMAAVALVAAMPAVIHAVRVDPAEVLRGE